mgnify:CR=1 FL=1
MNLDEELKDFWKIAYVAALHSAKLDPKQWADAAVRDYLEAVDYLELDDDSQSEN